MAILRQRLCRKNDAGSYDTVHFETSSGLVMRPDGTDMETGIAGLVQTVNGKANIDHSHSGYAAANHTHNNYAASNHSHNLSDMTGVLPVSKGGTGVTSIDALKTALGVTTASKPTVSISVGTTLNMGKYDWICVHEDVSYYYLMTKYVISSTTFGISVVYSGGSQAALMCLLFGTAIGVWGNSAFGEITVEGVKGYCHLATYAQMNGGFSHFSSNANRVATNTAGTAMTYWTSSSYNGSYVYYVSTGGSFSNIIPGNALGFRPFVALKK